MGRPVVRWQILSREPDYRELCTGADEGIDGGFWPAPPQAHPFVQLFVALGTLLARELLAQDGRADRGGARGVSVERLLRGRPVRGPRA